MWARACQDVDSYLVMPNSSRTSVRGRGTGPVTRRPAPGRGVLLPLSVASTISPARLRAFRHQASAFPIVPTHFFPTARRFIASSSRMAFPSCSGSAFSIAVLTLSILARNGIPPPRFPILDVPFPYPMVLNLWTNGQIVMLVPWLERAQLLALWLNPPLRQSPRPFSTYSLKIDSGMWARACHETDSRFEIPSSSLTSCRCEPRFPRRNPCLPSSAIAPLPGPRFPLCDS